jgi:hypothetical protein
MSLAIRLIIASMHLVGIFAVFICIGIICGRPIAYFVARCLYAGITFLFALNAINPMAYREVCSTEGGIASLIWLFLRLMLVALISATLYWCLTEHLKMLKRRNELQNPIGVSELQKKNKRWKVLRELYNP